MSLLEELEWRGLVADISDRDALAEALEEPLTLYCGYDPTATSLHIGNLQMIVTQRRFQLRGHQVIALTGGGTGLIGDPGGKSTARPLRDADIVEQWAGRIRKQLEGLLRPQDGLQPPVFVDNHEWLSTLSAIELLRDIGSHFPLGSMLAKESVASRLEGDAQGMSFTEFSYMVLQAYDFLVLYDRGCRLQIGGSDQWGNITAGLELLRRTGRPGAMGMTSPLILRSDGKKFGKSEEGAVWLDPSLTSPFAFYQYFINVPDTDADGLLRRLTFLDRAEITDLAEATANAPQERRAQRRLAEELTRFVHGEEGLDIARRVTDWLFGRGELPAAAVASPSEAFAGAPHLRVRPAEHDTWASVAVAAGLAGSNSEARRLVRQGGLHVGDVAVSEDAAPSAQDFPAGPVVMRRGRRQRVILVCDTE